MHACRSTLEDPTNALIDGRYASILGQPAIGTWSPQIIARSVAVPSMAFVLGTGIVLAVPFMLGGLFIALAFRSAPDQTGRLYGWDLLGAAAGCVFTVAALTYVSASTAIVLIGLGGSLAALMMARVDTGDFSRARAAAAVSALLAGLMAVGVAGVETFPFRIHRYAHMRSFLDGPLEELRSQWTPLGRIALLQRQWSPPLNAQPKPRPKTFVAMDLGGHAVLEAFTPENLELIKDTSVFSDDVIEPINVPGLYLQVRDYLVLMAGTGQDMLRAYAMYGDQPNLQGVELNPVVYNFGLDYLPGHLQEFFKKPTVSMAIDEGRSFVERSSRSYDVILLSYSGATFATGTGSLASTPQFLFTREAFELYLSRLNPGGVLLDAAGADPGDLPVSLRTFDAALARVQPGSDTRRHIVTYRRAGGGPRSDHYTLFHRDPVTAGQVARLERALGARQLEVTYSPFTAPMYSELAAYFQRPAEQRATNAFAFASRAASRVHTDDRPFYYFDLVWGLQGGYLVLGYFVTLVGALGIAGLFLLVPLALSRRTAEGPNLGSRHEFASVALLGLGFMLLEVGSIQKFELFLGSPTLTLVAVLAVLVLCSAIGSFYSTSLFDRGWLAFRNTSVGIVLYGAFVLLFVNRLMYGAMGLPLAGKIVVIAVVLFPLGFLLGTLFPQLLRQLGARSERLIAIALAINGIFSVFAANLGAILYLLSGANVVFVLGLLSYAALGLIQRGHPAPQTEAVR